MQKFIRLIEPHQWVVYAFFVVVALLIGGASWYGYGRFMTLSSQVALLSTHIESLDEKLASTTELLEQSIAETQVTFGSALEEEKKNVVNIKEQLGSFQEEVGSISGTVNTLEKLSKTDPELLQKYSKVFFLNEHYAPDRLAEIPDAYEYYEYKHTKIHASVWPYLENMLGEAKNGGIEIYVYSGYRSFDEQLALKGAYTVTYGEGSAHQFSADQGYSEHQLGTTADLITPGIGGTLNGFEATAAYQWLLQNAHRFGFTLSYPEDNGYYVFEPWHWRFVGVELATKLYDTGSHFYDLDQREIDGYLVHLFE